VHGLEVELELSRLSTVDGLTRDNVCELQEVSKQLLWTSKPPVSRTSPGGAPSTKEDNIAVLIFRKEMGELGPVAV